MRQQMSLNSFKGGSRNPAAVFVRLFAHLRKEIRV